MNRQTTRQPKKYFPLIIGLVIVLLSASIGMTGNAVYAQSPKPPELSPFFLQSTKTLADGTSLLKTIIHGPPVPPPGFESQMAPVQSMPESATTLSTVPAFTWVMGCSAVSAAMIAGYYDNKGFPNMYAGPKNAGVMPMTNVWGTWRDGSSAYPNNPLIASKQGVDGRTTKGSINDYWVRYGLNIADPFLLPAPSWTQHAWGNAISDFMKTSQSKYGNTDGSTSFYFYSGSNQKLTCADMAKFKIQNFDGTYGRMLFYKARGYSVNLTTGCFSQLTSNVISGGFSLASYKAEINAGRPVLINLAGHSIVGVGYGTDSTIYIHDTWSTTNHAMTWGGSYAGMGMQAVSIVNPAQ